LIGPTFRMSSQPTSTVVLEGDLDLAAIKTFKRAMRPAIQHGGPVTIDASQLMFMDSTGIRLLIDAADRLKPNGCLIIHGLNDRIRRVIELTGIRDRVENLHLLDH
jgi:anti-sigma B factor antagonist